MLRPTRRDVENIFLATLVPFMRRRAREMRKARALLREETD